MQGSQERVRAVLHGKMPDRPPVYDLVRNDAVISHFAGETLTVENAAEVVPRAFRNGMVDATRSRVRLPENEREEIGQDGRRLVHYRWTAWRQHRTYESSEAYAEAHRRKPDESWDWTPEDQESLDAYVVKQRRIQESLGDVFYFRSALGAVGLMSVYGEVGLEQFSYCLADYPQAISDQLEGNTVKAVQRIEHLPDNARPEAIFLGDDMAFKGGPICSPVWLRREFFPRLKRIIDAWHRIGTTVLFHSDGNLMPVLDDFVEAGADGLNPIEVAAGMDIAEIHRRYPHLFMCGGIDVSQLLAFGTPQQVRDATNKAIEDAGGRLMPGSSTEIHNDVPLENYLAMRQTALDYRY